MGQQNDMNQTSDNPSGVTKLGHVLSVRGSEAQIGLPAPRPGAPVLATVGNFVAINATPRPLVGMITEVTAPRPENDDTGEYRPSARVALMGEFIKDRDGREKFRRGVSDYPAIGDTVGKVSNEQLRLIHKPAGQNSINVGHLNHDSSIAAELDVDSLVSKHFAILGSTGVGKSSGVTIILSEILKARPDLRIFLLDGHNEYGNSFGSAANVISSRNLRLPFWLFNFEELTDVIYAGRQAISEEIEILSELIPLAKNTYLNQKVAADRVSIKRGTPKNTGYTVDTPVPYQFADLMALVDERMGKLENRSSRMNYHRLMMRLETITNDPRYAFMFENATVGGDTMVKLLTDLFRLEPNGKPMSIMQLAGLPVEVVDAVVCLLCRLAFDFGLWSEGKMPLLFVCEEAHRYASTDKSIGFAPTRAAISRMAKEGRKYGVFMGLVTQRPAELDPTIISQCSTLFAMRLANDNDQALLRSAVSDSGANLLDFVPALGTGEVIGFGEAMPIPARFTFKHLEQRSVPGSKSGNLSASGLDAQTSRQFVASVIEKWRGVVKKPEPETGTRRVSLDRASPERPPLERARLDEPRQEPLSRDRAAADRAPLERTPLRREQSGQSQQSEQSGEAIPRLLDDARRQILKR